MRLIPAVEILAVSMSLLVCVTCEQYYNNKLDGFPNKLKGGNYTKIVKDGQLKQLSWDDCGDSSDAIQMLFVAFEPDPPQKGASLTINTKFQLNKEVSGGSVILSIKYLGYIPVYKESIDLCDLAAEMKESCPLSTGVHENYLVDTFPTYALSGKYSGTVKTVDDYNNKLSCTKIEFSV